MYEKVKKPVIPPHQFRARLARSMLLGAAMIFISLTIGMVGFLHYFPKMDWADAFVNASMLLSGMGPLAQPETTSAKVFSGMYALFSGLMLVMTTGVIFAPLVHRFLHVMHSDADKPDAGEDETEGAADSKKLKIANRAKSRQSKVR